MMIVLRSVPPVHRGFDSESDALAAFERFTDAIASAGSDELVTVIPEAHSRFAFIKRDFRYIDLGGEWDHDGGEGADADPSQAETLRPPAGGPVEVPVMRGPISALEAALKDAMRGCVGRAAEARPWPRK